MDYGVVQVVRGMASLPWYWGSGTVTGFRCRRRLAEYRVRIFLDVILDAVQGMGFEIEEKS